jgi:DHA1 family tetracycline resistance protein-like MFS transporter
LRPLLALFIVCIIDVLGFGILIPLVPYMADRFGAPPALITPILGSYSLCQLLAAPLWGRLSDRFGRRPILISSMLGACASYVILGFAHGIGTLFLSRMLAGAMAGNLSAAMAYATDVSPPSQRARALGTVGAAIGIGFMLGPAIGGLLAGNDLSTANFLRPALVSASLSVVAMLLVIFLLTESHRSLPQIAAARRRTPWRLLAERPGLRWLTLATLLVTFSQSTLESIFAIWAMHRYHVGPQTIGLALFGLAMVAVSMQGGLVRVLAPRFGEHRLALAAIVSYVAGLLLLAMAASLPLVVLALVLCGLGAGIFNPSGSALASHQAQHGDRGAVMGLYQSGNSLARVLAPFIAGPVYMRFGAGAPYLLASLVTLQALWCIQGARRLSAPSHEAA